MSIWLSLGARGFCWSGGLFQELRLGVISIGWCRGAIAENLRTAAARLRMALGAR